MNNSGRTSKGREDNVFSVVCPYLGLPDDPQTYIAWAQPTHICYRATPSQPITIFHQQKHCLSLEHTACRIYSGGWMGTLPPEILGDVEVKPAANPQDWRHADVPLDDDEELPPAVPADLSSLSLEEEDTPDEVEPELIDSLRSDYEVPLEAETSESSFDRRLLWAIPLLLLVLVCLVGGGLAGFNYSLNQRSARQTSSAEQFALAQAATQTAGAPTSTATTDPAVLAAGTATAEAIAAQLTEAAAPTDTATLPAPTPTPTPTVLPPTATPTEPLFSCEQIEAYTLELVDGPQLEPNPGFIYIGGTTPPVVQATWLVANTSHCDWVEINLYSLNSSRLLKPVVLALEVEVTPTPEPGTVSVLAEPGEVIAIRLPFSASSARNIQNEWIVEVNGWRLFDQPHLPLYINNWVLYQAPTATPRPPGGGNGGSGSSQPTATTGPGSRPTEPVPTTRP